MTISSKYPDIFATFSSKWAIFRGALKPNSPGYVTIDELAPGTINRETGSEYVRFCIGKGAFQREFLSPIGRTYQSCGFEKHLHDAIGWSCPEIFLSLTPGFRYDTIIIQYGRSCKLGFPI
jgi:hypothetical protein